MSVCECVCVLVCVSVCVGVCVCVCLSMHSNYQKSDLLNMIKVVFKPKCKLYYILKVIREYDDFPFVLSNRKDQVRRAGALKLPTVKPCAM